MTVGLLSTLNAPLLPYMLESVLANGVKDVVILLDSKVLSAKDLGLWRDRTGGLLDGKMTPDGNADLYAFEAQGVPVYFVKSHNGEACLRLIADLGITCLLSAFTPRKLNSAVLNAVPQGVINVHPGLLPKYRGSSCVEWAIYNDDQVGNTAHFMTEGYDEGPVIDASACAYFKDATYQEIRTKTYLDAVALAGRTVAKVVRSGLRPADAAPQTGEGTTWAPIPADKMAAVMAKIEARAWPYMRLSR